MRYRALSWLSIPVFLIPSQQKEFRDALSPFGCGGRHEFLHRRSGAERASNLLVSNVDVLRIEVHRVKDRYPLEILAMVVLPDRLHVVCALPAGDSDYLMR